MKLYFASSSARWPLVRSYIKLAKSFGHEVTMDWTPMVEEFGRGDPGVNDPAFLLEAASDDRAGVFDCEVLVNLFDSNQCGALLETGGALWLGKRVWICAESLNDIRYAIFWELPQVELMTLTQLERRLRAKEATQPLRTTRILRQ